MPTMAEILQTKPVGPEVYADFVRLELRRRSLQADLAAVEKEQAALGQRILRDWDRSGTQREKCGRATLFRRSDFLVLPTADREVCCQALCDCDYGELVHRCFDERELRHRLKKEGGIPAELTGCFSGWTRETLAIRINQR